MRIILNSKQNHYSSGKVHFKTLDVLGITPLFTMRYSFVFSFQTFTLI